MEPFNWSTFWTAIGALAAIAAILVPAIKQIKRSTTPRIFKIFLSMQMSHLQDEEYGQVRHEILELVSELRKNDDVFFYNENIQHANEFNENEFNPGEYLKEINKCDYFIAILIEKILSSIYFEAGYALGIKKNSIYFVTDEKVMPILMRSAGVENPKMQVIRAKSIAEIKPRIVNILNNNRKFDKKRLISWKTNTNR